MVRDRPRSAKLVRFAAMIKHIRDGIEASLELSRKERRERLVRRIESEAILQGVSFDP